MVIFTCNLVVHENSRRFITQLTMKIITNNTSSTDRQHQNWSGMFLLSKHHIHKQAVIVDWFIVSTLPTTV